MSRMLRRQFIATTYQRASRQRRSVSIVDIPLDETAPDAPSASPRPGTQYPPESNHVLADPTSLIWGFLCLLAKSVCVRVIRPLATVCRWTFASPVPLRVTVLAGFVLLACVFSARVVNSEIDLTKLMSAAAQDTGQPRIVVQNGRLMNAGDGPARNLEFTKPSYRLIGTLEPGEALAPPANAFSVQFEFTENGQTKRATRSFTLAGNERVAGQREKETDAPGTSILPATLEASTSMHTPPGIAAEYDPATHLLTVTAQKAVEVRVDGFLLRPIARTDKDGGQYRYVQANVLVLGQDIRQGDTVQFEVVFTKPQDFYSIPIYVREPGKPASYFTVSVSTGAHT